MHWWFSIPASPRGLALYSSQPVGVAHCSPCEIRGFLLVLLPGLSLPQESCRPNRTQALWASPASRLEYSGWRPRPHSLHPRKRQDTCSRLKPGRSTLLLSTFTMFARATPTGCYLYEPSSEGWRGC